MAGALRRSLDASRPVLLYGAPLVGEWAILGAHQHAESALADRGLPSARRHTGGCLLRGGDGIVYIALGLQDRSSLMACPPGKILNRNVRGFLAGMRAAGVAAAYFGRDFVSVEVRPATYIGWDCDEQGRVLVEFFVSLTSHFSQPELSAYPAHSEPQFRGRPPITLSEAGVELPAPEFIERVARGYATANGADFQPVAPTEEELAAGNESCPADDDAELTWSAPIEEVIGFVGAGVCLDSDGRIEKLRMAGDMFQERAFHRRLSEALVGKVPDELNVGEAIDVTYGPPGAIEGVRKLQNLRAALLDAAARAAQETR